MPKSLTIVAFAAVALLPSGAFLSTTAGASVLPGPALAAAIECAVPAPVVEVQYYGTSRRVARRTSRRVARRN